MRRVGDMERERCKVKVRLSGRCVLSWSSVVIVIHLPNTLSRNRNGTMTSANLPWEMEIGVPKVISGFHYLSSYPGLTKQLAADL